ncbi:MAG: MFS transporter [Nisaea sp.]|nr:MFS transporter [Nisaea sp.]MEC9101148.1 MFS transporter [Pseudomonadota bacterium]
MVTYSFPALAISIPTIPLYLYLPTFYGVTLELGLAATGFALLTARVFDTITDPIVGIISDRFPIKRNYRKPWIAVGSIIAAIGLYQLLNPPNDAGIIYLICWSIILYLGWTFVAVPYLTWGAELSTDYNERTSITTSRETAGILGILTCGVIFTFSANLNFSEIDTIGIIGWATIGLGAISIPYMLKKVPDAGLVRLKKGKNTNRSFLRSVLQLTQNRLFVRLLAAWFLNGIANGIPSVLFFLYLDKVLGVNETQRAVLILIYFSTAVAAMPAWLSLSKVFNKHRVWCYAMILAIGAFSLVPFLPEGAFYLFSIICILTGVCLGADLSIPPSIQADVLDYDKLKTRSQRAGLLFSLWGMATKLALACSVGLAFPLLDWLGFEPDMPDDSGRQALVFLYALLPVGFKCITVLAIWNFPLNRKNHTIIKRRLYGPPAPTN